ncbi:MAG: transcription-repair coupling factor [Bacilli bacterium]|nr:transcription-repair coupling factor [Bacilli bacterium]MDD4076603.1 transcription-repair coupling factor [Bacilli bacterium]
MNNILEIFSQDKAIRGYLEAIKCDNYSCYVSDLSYNHGYLLSYLSFLESNDFVVYVANNLYYANQAYDIFCKLAGSDKVNLYVVDELVSIELIAVSADFKYERLDTIKNVLSGEKKIIVTHPPALLRPLMRLERYRNAVMDLNKNTVFPDKSMVSRLVEMGYKRVPLTTMIGEFSIRGEIIDVFSGHNDYPVRVNLFDTEIESLKLFDVETQKSIKQVNNYQIYPLNELIYSDDEFQLAADKIRKDCSTVPRFLDNDLTDMGNYENLERINKYIRYIEPQPVTFLDYLESKIVIYQDYQRLKENYQQMISDLSNYLDHLDKPKNLNLFFFFDFYNIFHHSDRKIIISENTQSLNEVIFDQHFSLRGYAVVGYQNDIRSLIADLKANPKKTFIFALMGDERINLICEIFLESGLVPLKISSFSEVKKQKINLIKCENAIAFGFIESNVEVITEKEIFKQVKSHRPKYRHMQHTVPIASKEDLQTGDYVVHYDYGIGRYLGIKTVQLKDIRNDYIMLQYQNMELYIPVEKVSLLEKYQGSEGTIPKLTIIGKGEWEKKKQKIKEKLENIAAELITIQAKREQTKGFKYSPDSEFQRLFEEDFEFEETVDQLKAITEIKKDMEEGKVIDRLICGDVGYGKTEIAMRIAFKAVYSNKQVAYLAPTTILTRQHYYTFQSRFEKYGIRVELLNRLVSYKRQKEIIKDLKAGMVDIVIGTHRLLSKDIAFKNLGLLIVDEEQRFGVVHKEKIKKIKENVNVLTLTATPIPRTLQMSIVGIRQLSLIGTPPKDRYPIQTYVVEKNDIVIKEAIYREMARGGQVFYLYNRIVELDRMHRRLHRLVPEARICIAHGKMSKTELENTVQDFIDYKYDILLCTTIIEIGIDIPNTNTLIIDGADFLGLSQIYQIRGRVGRSDRIAYAYLMYEADKVLTEDAVKRLNSIKEFTTLGSGYKIAVRDLAIRGAGDILGKEQSGFIDDIGLDMYLKLLDESVNQIKGEKEQEEAKDYVIEVSKHVDESYVSDDDIKILIHKEINRIKSKVDKTNLIDEFTDRFGRLNNEILTYIEERYLQILLKKFEAENILETQNKVMVIISEEKTKNIDPEKLFLLATNINKNIEFEYKRRKIIIKIPKKSKEKKWIFELSSLLESQM